MTRGGARPGAGRKPGSRDLKTVQLERALIATGANDFVGALVTLIEDDTTPEELRISACQVLSGRLMSRVMAPQQIEKQFPRMTK